MFCQEILGETVAMIRWSMYSCSSFKITTIRSAKIQSAVIECLLFCFPQTTININISIKKIKQNNYILNYTCL